MKEVLMVYQEVQLQNEAHPAAGAPSVITVSIDEKPGVQAIANTAPDLPPVPGKHPTVSRNHEYKRHGTLSIPASLDLHDGHVVARVEERHRSREFVALLKDLDAYYPAEANDSVDSGQPFGAHLQGDACLSGDPAQPFSVCSYAQAWLLAELGGYTLWEDGPHLLAA